MKIKEIELNDIEKQFIYNKLIELYTGTENTQIEKTGVEEDYNLNARMIAESTKGIEVNFPLNDLIEVWATLDLNVECDDFHIDDMRHSDKPIQVYTTLKIDIYHNCEPVKGLERWNIEDLIGRYDWLQYF